MKLDDFFPLMHAAVDGDAGGAPGGGAPAGADTMGGGEDKVEDLDIRATLDGAAELEEKGEDSPDLSKAARTLAAARKREGRPAPKVEQKPEDKAKGDAAAQRAAELAAMDPAARAAAEAEDKKKAEEAAAQSAVEAPSAWSAADREMFAKQSPEAKQWLLRRHKEMEDGFQKRMQEISPTRRLNEELDEVFKPHEEVMRQAGMTRAQAIRELVGWKERLDKNPLEALKYLAHISGVDLKQAIEGAAAADPAGESPTVVELRKQVQELTGQIQRVTGTQNDQQMKAQLSQVQAFAEEKDAQGQPLRPHFDEVAKDVAAMIRIAKSNGETVTLQDAYDRAVHANPSTRAKLLAANEAERRRKDEEERKAKAEAARKASATNIEGQGAASTLAAQTGSIREDLESAFSAVGDRV